MKRIYVLSLILASLLMSCGVSQEEARDYNDAIILKQKAIMEKMNALNATYENYVPEEMDAAYSAAIDEVKKSISELEAMPALTKNDILKPAALELFNTYLQVLENDHKQLIAYYKVAEDEFTAEHYDKCYDLAEKINNKLDKALAKFISVQEKFAKEYNLVLKNIEE